MTLSHQVRHFLAWWRRNLVACLPPALASLRRKMATVIVQTEPAENRVRIFLDHGEAEREILQTRIGDPDLRAQLLTMVRSTLPSRIKLRIPDEQVLVRSVSLPLAARNDLAGLFEFEMDRLTPFKVHDVFWDWVVTDRNRATGLLSVDLILTARSWISSTLEWLEQQQMPASIVAGSGSVSQRDIHLEGHKDRGARRSVNVALVATGLACACICVLFGMQSFTQFRLQRDMQSLAPQVSEAHDLQARLAANTLDAHLVHHELSQDGDILSLISLLTQSLPDDTYLTDLSVKAGKLVMNGQSRAAASLIATLSDNRAIRNPAFVAPITHVQSADADTAARDVFSVQAEVALP